VLHWYNWHRDYGSQSIDCYPHYFPTRPGFRPAVRKLRAAGLTAMPYFNARLWRTDFASWGELGRRAAVRDAYGAIHPEVWMRIPTAVMNPASRLWQEVLGGQLLRCVDCGCNGIYLDQLAASVPWPSYDPAHPHEPGETAAWVQGTWQLCDRVRSAGRAIEPDLILAAEGNAEPYLGWIDTFLCGNLNAPNSVPLYAAVYHDYVMTFGRYILAPDLTLPRAVLAKFAQQFVFGGQFGWSRARLDGFLREDNPQAVCLREMAQLRTAHADLLAAGMMLRPLRFEPGENPELDVRWRQWSREVRVHLPQVLSSVWQRADGRIGVLLVNIGDTARKLVVRLPETNDPAPAGTEARAYTAKGPPGGRIIVPVGDPARLAVTIPALTPILVTVAGKPPPYPSPPPKPALDLLGGGRAAGFAGILPFRPPAAVSRGDSRLFPIRCEGDIAPDRETPAWIPTGSPESTARDRLAVRAGMLVIDNLTPGKPAGAAMLMPPGPGWDVDPMIGFTVECRLRVTACNHDPRFAFWLQTNAGRGLMCLQIFPDRIVIPGRAAVSADMHSGFRTVRVTGLPVRAGVRVFLDGRVIADRAPYLNGHPSQTRCLFGAGAAAGRIRAEVDYVRLQPCRARAR
jgi:hypothetical protein